MICAIIAAAGQGRRMNNSIFKQFLTIENKPIIAYTLEKFCQCTSIDCITIVIPEDQDQVVQYIIKKYQLTKVRNIVVGGATRQKSVFEALKTLDSSISTVVIHDAVRPLISLQLIDNVIKRGIETGAAVVAVPVQESLKKCSNNEIIYSLNRDSVWLAQTPQVFEKKLILRAHEQAVLKNISATDDAELVEYLGYPIHIVAGEITNIKITTQSDFELASLLIRNAF